MRDIATGALGWVHHQRAKLIQRRHPEQGEVSAYCFYNVRLRARDLAFDIGANHGVYTALMLARGARVVAIEPQPQLAAELERRFPQATVLAAAVADRPGEADLHLDAEDDQLASLDRGWEANETATVTWQDTVTVPVTTVDELIDRYGVPKLLKVDTEGFDHKVLRGLSQPVEHILFEVHAAFPHVPREAFAHLDELGHYEYGVSFAEDWNFRTGSPQEIAASLPLMGNVYARLR